MTSTPTRLISVDTRVAPRVAVVCAWCEGGKELTARLYKCGWSVSHGMCPACARAWDQRTLAVFEKQRELQKGELE